MKKVITVIDAIGEKHTVELDAYHVMLDGHLAVSMIFDNGKGGHYIFNEIGVKEMLQTIIAEMR